MYKENSSFGIILKLKINFTILKIFVFKNFLFISNFYRITYNKKLI